jgi:type III secretion system YscQ/HrcQ family protein
MSYSHDVRGHLPYPLARLRRMTAGEAARRSRMARSLDLGDLERAAAAVGILLDAPITVAPAPIGICPSRLLDRVVPERCVAVAVASPIDPLRRRIVVEIDAAMARALVDRLLGATEPTAVEAPLGEGEAGMLLYLAARTVAETTRGTYQVVTVLTSRAALRAALDDGDLAFLPVRLEVASTQGMLRVWLPAELPPAEPSARAPVALGSLPISLRLFRGYARLTGDELARLAAGDAVLLDDAVMDGELLAEALGSSRTLLRCRLDGTTVVVQEVVPRRAAGARATSGESEGNAMSRSEAEMSLERVGDVEVELTVDVARLRLRLGELARIRPGEVLGTVVDVGERVRLRAGELDVAEGELVDVDGKLGVLVTKVFPTSTP